MMTTTQRAGLGLFCAVVLSACGGSQQPQSQTAEGQGVQALDALGTNDRVDCALAFYVATNAYRVARNADLIAALTEVFPDAATVLARYGVHP